MISVLGALNGNQLVGPRLLFAMGQDELVPGILCRIHPRYNTPANAGVTLSVISIVIVLAGSYIKPNGKALFDVITDFSMFGAISFGCLAVGSIFVVRKRYPVATHPLPYRCPGYPLPPVLYIVFMIGVIANMFVTQQNEAIAGVILIAVGGLIYFAIFRNKPVAVQRPA
jgi:amino acid transporter